MSKSRWAPSIVPDFDTSVYLVLQDFGSLGRAYAETDESAADLETVIEGLIAGQYDNPIRIIAFNTAEGWSLDVSEDVAREVQRRSNERQQDLSSKIFEFVDHQLSMTSRRQTSNAQANSNGR
jgi:hypothetical protein